VLVIYVTVVLVLKARTLCGSWAGDSSVVDKSTRKAFTLVQVGLAGNVV